MSNVFNKHEQDARASRGTEQMKASFPYFYSLFITSIGGTLLAKYSSPL